MIKLSFYAGGLLISKLVRDDRHGGIWRSSRGMVDFRTTTTKQFAHQLAQALKEAGVECELNEELLEDIVDSDPDDILISEDEVVDEEENIFDEEYAEDEVQFESEEERLIYEEMLDLDYILIDRELTAEEENRARYLRDRLETIRGELNGR